MRVPGLDVRDEGPRFRRVVRVRLGLDVYNISKYIDSLQTRLLNLRHTYCLAVFWHFKLRFCHRRATRTWQPCAGVGNSGI